MPGVSAGCWRCPCTVCTLSVCVRLLHHQHGSQAEGLCVAVQDTDIASHENIPTRHWLPPRCTICNDSYCIVTLLLAVVVTVIILPTLACDYSMIDPMHTMCVFAPRMCHKKKLLRKFQSELIGLLFINRISWLSQSWWDLVHGRSDSKEQWGPSWSNNSERLLFDSEVSWHECVGGCYADRIYNCRVDGQSNYF